MEPKYNVTFPKALAVMGLGSVTVGFIIDFDTLRPESGLFGQLLVGLGILILIGAGIADELHG